MPKVTEYARVKAGPSAMGYICASVHFRVGATPVFLGVWRCVACTP